MEFDAIFEHFAMRGFGFFLLTTIIIASYQSVKQTVG
jgi:hypothetical protein